MRSISMLTLGRGDSMTTADTPIIRSAVGIGPVVSGVCFAMFVSLVVAGHEAGEVSIGNLQSFGRRVAVERDVVGALPLDLVLPVVLKLDQDGAEDLSASIDVGSLTFVVGLLVLDVNRVPRE